MPVDNTARLGSRRLGVVGAGLALVATLVVLMWSAATPAKATYYSGQVFCPTSGGVPQLWLPPGGRCVSYDRPRIKHASAVTQFAHEDYLDNPSWKVCIVGKANSDGSGGNVYPATCAWGWPTVAGQTISNPCCYSWPTVINQAPVSLKLHGYWNGYFP